jgi:hypothetical protein
LPTYIGYLENSVFQRIELTARNEEIKKFLNGKSPIIMSNSDSYYALSGEPYSNPEKISKQFKNTSDTNTLIDNLKQTGPNADKNIGEYVTKNFIKFNAIVPNAEIVRIE